MSETAQVATYVDAETHALSERSGARISALHEASDQVWTLRFSARAWFARDRP